MVQLISGGADGQADFEKDGAVIKMMNKEMVSKKRGKKKKSLLLLAPEKCEVVKKEEDTRIFKEGPLMTKCDGVWVKRQFVEEYEKLKVSVENQILLSREKKKLLYKARRAAHKKLVNELYKEKNKKAKKLKSLKKTLPPPKAISLKETKELSRKFEEKKRNAGSGKNKKATKAVEGDNPENQVGKEVTKQKNKGKKGAVTTKKTSKIEDGEAPLKLTKKRKPGKDGDCTEETTGAKKPKKGKKKGSNAEMSDDEIVKEKKSKKTTALKEKAAKKAKESPVLEFKENETMTKIDGFWIRKESGQNLEDLRSNLTSDKMMKKKLRSEQRKLVKKLKKSELKKE